MSNDQRMTNAQCAMPKGPPRSRPLVIGNWAFIGHCGIGHWSFAQAFTLIELILVMALLSIVLAISAPALSNFFRGRNLDSEARRFVSLTRYAQSRAVSEGVPMLLWIDIRQGAYGLQQEPGYAQVDTKAVDFVLGKDLRIAVADVPILAGQMRQTRPAAQANPNVPRLRFQPDGFIDQINAQTVIIRENSGESLWITQSRNRLNYEIHTNSFQGALR